MNNFYHTYKIYISSKGIQQTLINTIGNYSSALLAALAIIIISRHLGPTVFGEFSAAFSLGIVLAKINDAGITIATQKFASQSKKKKDIKSFVYYGYKLKLILSTIIIVTLLLLSPKLTEVFKFSSPFIVPISVLFGITITYYDQLAVTLLATHFFVKASFVNLSQALFKLVFALSLTKLYPEKILPILASFLFAPGFPVLLKHFFEPEWFRKITKIHISKKNKEKFLHLSKHSAILVFSGGVIDYIGVLFVKNFTTSYEAGLLGGVSRVALLFSLIGVSLSQVLYNRVSRYKLKTDLDSFLKKAYLLSAGMVIVYFCTLPLLSFITKITIGTDYLVALYPLRVLLASVFIYVISIPFSALFYSFDKDSYFSISGIIQLVSLLIGNYLLVPQGGITGSAYAQLLSRIILLVFTILFACKAYKEKYNTQDNENEKIYEKS